MQEDLKKFGLSQNGIKIYLSLIKIGETTVGDIILDTRLHRQSVYNALEELERKEMVIKNKKNKINHYKISDPKILIENSKKQQLLAQRISKTIKEIYRKSRHEHEINVYDGREKIRKFFSKRNDRIPSESTLCILSNYANKYEEIVTKEYLVKLDKEKSKKKIKIKIITSESMRQEFSDLDSRLSKKVNRTIKYIPDDLMNPLATEIWQGGISFNSFENDWFVIEIKNKTFYEPYTKYFNALWKIAKQ